MRRSLKSFASNAGAVPVLATSRAVLIPFASAVNTPRGLSAPSPVRNAFSSVMACLWASR